MQRSTLAWDDVRLFLALFRARTLGEAGRVLGVDTSTVSRRLKALEAALDATLFDRGRDGVRATEAAEDLLPAAELVEHGVLQFAHATDGLERKVAGQVRITCPPDAVEVYLLPLLQPVLQAHPNLEVVIEPSESVRDLTRREADIGLRVVRPARGDLVVKRLRAVPWRLVGSPALVEGLGEVARWSDLPWLAYSEQLAGMPAVRWMAERLGDTQPRLRSDSMNTLVAAAKAGIGVGLLPAPTADFHGLRTPRLAPDLAEELGTLPEASLFLVTHRVLRTVPRIRAVWDAIADAA